MIALISTPVKQAIYFSGHVRNKMSHSVPNVGSRLPSYRFCVRDSQFQPKNIALCMSRRSFSISSIGYQVFHQCFSKQRSNLNPLKSIRQRSKRLGMPSPLQNTRLVLSSRSKNRVTKIGWNTGSSSWLQGGGSIGMLLGLSICFASTKPSYAEASSGKNSGSKEDCESVGSAHGKQVYTNYSITGIPGDGRCLFRSVAHGACLRSGNPSPKESLQRELADDLRAKVADEFIKRREESEWFVEGDFDSYVSQIRKPHVWGGEPELFMASHVLQMPITVYMYDENAGGLISIAEYGQEYGKENPIRVLYHGFGHYDALLMPGKNTKSKL
ncbi:ubiquitinyl hydrolase 1 [Ranunculus cassubicifolius]